MPASRRQKEGNLMTPAKDDALKEIRDLVMEAPDDLAADTVNLINTQIAGLRNGSPKSGEEKKA